LKFFKSSILVIRTTNLTSIEFTTPTLLDHAGLWDLFSKEAVMVENTWNVSMRLMLDIPRENKQIKTILINRFLTFIEQIRQSNKSATKFILNSIHLDARSTTGSNVRNILLETDKASISDLSPNDAF
jgi:hypothetical protein